jgi:hypothetical protein
MGQQKEIKMDDELEQDRYSQDYRCEHGMYIGPPGGPDYMCGWCEDGVSRQEYLDIINANKLSDIRARSERVQFFLTLALQAPGASGIAVMEMARHLQ